MLETSFASQGAQLRADQRDKELLVYLNQHSRELFTLICSNNFIASNEKFIKFTTQSTNFFTYWIQIQDVMNSNIFVKEYNKVDNLNVLDVHARLPAQHGNFSE